uniref:Uncharacterized protein n=1 Tax=Anguilla anguilla TaxID=7936 RepID=A0A0E9QPP6_ANGAN
MSYYLWLTVMYCTLCGQSEISIPNSRPSMVMSYYS